MWTKLKPILWEWRGVLITAPSVTALLIALRFAGLWQLLELATLDQLFRRRFLSPVDPRIVIVGITESDIQKIGNASLSDALLAQLLEKLKQQQPRAIGLDIYRDLPEQQGYDRLVKVFQSTPNLIGIRKVVGNGNDSPIKPPPELNKLGQIGANDMPQDADTKIRRCFLYLKAEDGKIVPSLGLRLAEIYLKAEGILNKPAAVNPKYLQLGKVVFVRFKGNDGGYVRTNAQGYQILLNFRGPQNNFRTVSVTDVLEDKVPSDLVRDRIVLIGAIAESKRDYFLTPYSSTIVGIPEETSGVEIQANVTSQILSAVLDGRPLIKTWAEPIEWVWIFAWSVVGATLGWKWRYTGGVAKFSPLEAGGILLAGASLFGISYLAFLGGWWIPVVPPALGMAGGAIAITNYLARTAAHIRHTFSRYLSDEVVANLLETPGGLKLGRQRQKVTILISDLRGFSAVSEQYLPETVVTMLNIYLEEMTEAIAKYNGTIDEFIGDAILVLFGAPTQKEDDAQRAVACAIAMQLAMSSVNQKLSQLGLPKIQMGIGINTGEVVVGNIGSQKRAKYAVVGSHINLASRIESNTVGGEIIISEATLKDAGDIVHIDRQIQEKFKGFEEAIAIYYISGISGKYNLFLPKEEERYVDLREEIPIAYTVIEGKSIGETVFQGRLVRLSENGAEVRSEHIVDSLRNIKINILSKTEKDQKLGDVYAKVTGKSETRDSFFIRFTYVTADVALKLSALFTHRGD